MPKKVYKKDTDKQLKEVGILPSLTEWNGKVNKSGDTIIGKLTVQSGDASGCLQIGADVASNTLTAGTRKLARMTFPTREYGTTKTCSIMSCDNMNKYNYVEFGGHIGDATNTAPDYMCFNVDKTHNSLSPATKECVMAISPTSLRLFNGAVDAGQITSFDSISGKWVFNNANTFKNSGFTYILPNKTGTVALTGDIPIKVSQLENDSNMVTFASSQTATVAGTSKTTYTYNQPTGDSDTGSSNGSAYFPEGIIMGGTAASAGLVTRGICGVSTPDATTGACNKENLYINYDGNNTYQEGRQLVLQAGTVGTNYGHNLYQYAAARGDAVKNYCDATYAKKSDVQSSLSSKADLENGKVPSSQLPSYVDDVEEYTSKSGFPATGTTGKIYVDTTTNLTYRWSGTAYVEISPSLALGETSSTAYAGNKGAENAKNINTILGYFDSDGKAKTAISAISAIYDKNGRDITATYALTSDLPTQATSTKLGLVKSSTTGTAVNRDYNVEVNSDGTMKVNVPWTYINTSHSHSAGVGLVGSGRAGASGTYTYKAKLRSETALTVDSAAATTSGRVYPVAVDKSGYLSLNVPLAGFEDILKGIKGRTQVEWNALNAGEYGSNSTYNGATLPPVLLENTSGFWNSASGKPLDISFHFAKKEKITTLQVKCPPYSGVNPTMTVYYAQKGDAGLTLYKEIATISTADRKAYEFNEEGISADYWVVRFTSSGWVDLKLCSPSGLFTTGLYTEECHQQIMDRFNGYQPVGNYQPKGDYVTYDNASKDIYLGSHGIYSGVRPSSDGATLAGNGYWIKPSSVEVSSALIGGTVPSVSSEMTPNYISVSNQKIILNSSGIKSDAGTFKFDGNPGSVATSADLKEYQKKGNYVTTDTAQTITGRKTFNSPANVNGQEVATAIFKTSNGGQLIIGKEGPNSGTMLRFDQTAGKTRLQFRASATLGAMVWTQPEKGAKLYFDLTNSEGVSTRTTLDARSGTIARTSDIKNGKITIKKNGTEVGSFTTNQSENKTIDLTLDVSDVYGLQPTLNGKMDTYTITSSPSSMGKDGFAQFGYDVTYGLTQYSQLKSAFGYVKVLEKGGEVSNNNSYFTGFGNVGGGTYIGTATYDRDYNFPDAALVASRGLLIDNYGSAFLLYGSRDKETKKELATKDDINSLQNSINGKANKTHTHAISEITNLQSTLDGKANIGHSHAISAISNLQSTLNGKQATLVSGTNIKTINGNSILGGGNLSIFSSLTEKEFHDIMNATSSMSSYIVIDKLLIQWGVYIGANGDTTNWEVTYPKEFWYYPAVILQTKDTITNNQGIPYSNGAVITSYRGGKAFTFQLRRSEKCPVYWIAIGGLR